MLSVGSAAGVVEWVEEALDVFMWQVLKRHESTADGVLSSKDTASHGNWIRSSWSTVGRSPVSQWLHMLAFAASDTQDAQQRVEHLMCLRDALSLKYEPINGRRLSAYAPSQPVSAFLLPHTILPQLFQHWIHQGATNEHNKQLSVLGRVGRAWHERWKTNARVSNNQQASLPPHVVKLMTAWRAQSTTPDAAAQPQKLKKTSGKGGDAASLDLMGGGVAVSPFDFERALDALIGSAMGGEVRRTAPPPSRPTAQAATTVSVATTAARGRAASAPFPRGGAVNRGRGAARVAPRRRHSPSSSSSEDETTDVTSSDSGDASTSTEASSSTSSDSDDPIQAIVRNKAAALKRAQRGRGRAQRGK